MLAGEPRDLDPDRALEPAGERARWCYHTDLARVASFRCDRRIAYGATMAGQTGAALRLWTASELRRRWSSLVILGLLAGRASGLAIAAFDGASRSGTAYTRMREKLAAADVVFYPSQVGVGDADVTKLGTLDEVEGWAGFAINDSNIDEPPGGAPFIAVGDGWFDTIERAKVLEGRLPDPDADDEAVVDVAATKLGVDVRVGSVFTWRSLSAEQSDSFPDGAPPDFDWTTAAGPVTKLRIVGIVRLPMQPVVSFASGGLAIVGPGWAEGAPGRNEDLLHQRARAARRTGRRMCRSSKPACRSSTAAMTSPSRI